MKAYLEPEMSIVRLENADIICGSGLSNCVQVPVSGTDETNEIRN